MWIKKEIVSVSPVRYYYPVVDWENPDPLKKIAFTVYFTDTLFQEIQTRKIPNCKVNFLVSKNTNTIFQENKTENFDKLLFEKLNNHSLKTYKTGINCFNNQDSLIISENQTKNNLSKVKKEKINGINFTETWEFDKNKFTFNKKIYSYTPYSVAVNDNLNEIPVSGRIINQSTTKNDLQLFKKIKYEVKSFQVENVYTKQNDTVWLDEKKEALFWNSYYSQNFKDYLIDNILDKEINIHDFYTGEQLSLAGAFKTDTIYDLNYETGEPVTIIIHDTEIEYLKSYIFIENWYFEPNTMYIKKEVVGIAPVFYIPEDIFDDNSETIRKIPFVIYFDETNKF